ncbi:MAG: polysaccharide biosynthesis protein, partial [Thermoguttaceae bacterium]
MNHSIWQRLRWRRLYLSLAVYLGILFLAFLLAFQLRFDFAVPERMRALFWRSLPWVLALKLTMFSFFGVIRGWWRHVSFADLAALLWVSLLSMVAIDVVVHFPIHDTRIPFSVILLDCGATILLLGGFRSAWRMTREHIRPRLWVDPRRGALMIGADRGGEALSRQIHANPKLDYRIVGFLDGNHVHHGSRLGGIPFLGSPQDAVRIAQRRRVRDILVIAHSLAGRQLRELASECRRSRIRLKMVPPVEELLDGSYSLQIRDVNINDLLRREPVQLDREAIDGMIRGHRVLVTGAGGSIGSEICRQILRCHPQSLILVERAENSLYQIGRELAETAADVPVVPCIADVGDELRMHTVFRQHRPQVIFHAAAHKHVPLMEHNPGEALKNNVLGTQRLADLSDFYGVERFVMISTDKAV